MCKTQRSIYRSVREIKKCNLTEQLARENKDLAGKRLRR